MSNGGLVLINMDEKERKEGKGKRAGRRGAHLKENLKAAKFPRDLGLPKTSTLCLGAALELKPISSLPNHNPPKKFSEGMLNFINFFAARRMLKGLGKPEREKKIVSWVEE
jgi:hypothetical protein